MSISKEEFLARLKENKKSFKTVEELIEYQLPVLQYYFNTYGKLTIIDNRPVGGKIENIDFSKIELIPASDEKNLELMNHAFEELKLRIGEFE